LKRYDYIDALRGYAVLGVLLVHCSQYVGFDRFAAFGARGVQLFFVVSALTLMSSWHSRDDGVTAFFLRRIFRIVPMYWLTILIYAFFPLIDHAKLDTAEIIGAAFFLQGLRPDWVNAPIVAGGWSVCVEVSFYFLFPLLVVFVQSERRAIGFFLISFLLYQLWLQGGSDLLTTLFPAASGADIAQLQHLSLPAQFPAFAAGIVCFYTIPQLSHVPRVALEGALTSSIAAIALFAVYDVQDVVAYALLFGVLTACLARGAGDYLYGRALIHIGRCSFSIYLLHWIAIGRIFPRLHQLAPTGVPKFAALFLGVVALSTLMATISYYLIERPMIRMGKRFVDSLANDEEVTVSA
jgi:peptidoglycan/LPS O-acetylase OafA/YrhL